MKKVLFATAIALAFCASASAARMQSSVRVGPLVDEREDAGESVPKNGDKKTDSKPAPVSANDPKHDAAMETKAERDKNPPALSSNTSNVPSNDATKPASTSDAAPKSNTVTVPTGVTASVTSNVAPSSNSGSSNSAASSNTPATSSNNGTASSNAGGTPSKTPAATANTTPATTPAAASTTPVNAAASPAPTAIYRVGAGDVLDIRLLNQATTRESTLYTVMNGGLLEYPLVGDPLNVANFTTDEIGARLAAELKRRAVFEKPQVVVSVREYASHTVLVSGLVADPGAKVLRREAVPLYVVIAEAQPRPDAGHATVIARASGQSTPVDLSDSTAMNLLVYPGDVINVTTRPREFFYIGGEINMPGQKDFHAGLTLTQAVLASGGVSRFAGNKVKVRVSRQGADGRLVSTQYLLKDIEEGRVPDPRMQPGDRIEVLPK